MLRDQRITRETGRQDNWLALLDSYGVQFLILDIEQDGDLLQSVQSKPGWTIDFQDTENVLLARTGRWPDVFRPRGGPNGQTDVKPGF
jgi:hypothetical protein